MTTPETLAGRTSPSGVVVTTPETLAIPWPVVLPLGQAVTAEAVQEVWDVFVKPVQDRDEPQSVEMRNLMAILRAVHHGLSRHA